MIIFPQEPELCERFVAMEYVRGLDAALKDPEKAKWLVMKGGLMNDIWPLDFPEELAQLSHLDILSCEYYSSLHKWDRLAGCPNLKTLILLGNEFRTEGITLELEHLPQLEHLYVDIFYPVVITEAIGKCTQLKTLWFDEVRLEGVEHLAQLGSLEELFIDTKHFESMMQSGKFPNLRRLKLDMEDYVPEVVSTLSLKTLALPSFYLKELPSWLGQMKGLEELDLCESQVEAIPDGFADLKRLEVYGSPLVEKADELRERFPKLEVISEL